MPKNLSDKESKTRDILGVGLSVTNKVKVISKIIARHKLGHKFMIVTPNPEQIVLATKDSDYKSILNKAFIKIPDGVGIIFAERFLYGKNLLEIIKGRELFLDIIKLANEKRWKVILLGDGFNSAQLAANKLSKRFKKVKLTAINGPRLLDNGLPVSSNAYEIEEEVIKKINQVKPDFLFEGFRSPVQEKWLDRNLSILSVIGTMVVGGTFDYISGKQKLPPKFIEKTGFEWLWRLFAGNQKLGRIWNAVVVFPWKVILYKLQK